MLPLSKHLFKFRYASTLGDTWSYPNTKNSQVRHSYHKLQSSIYEEKGRYEEKKLTILIFGSKDNIFCGGFFLTHIYFLSREWRKYFVVKQLPIMAQAGKPSWGEFSFWVWPLNDWMRRPCVLLTAYNFKQVTIYCTFNSS